MQNLETLMVLIAIATSRREITRRLENQHSSDNGECKVMISRNNILPTLLLVIAAVTLVNCAPAVPCNVAGNGSGAARLHRSSSTNICGNSGGGGGTPTCSSTLKPVQVLLSVDSKGAIQEYGIDSTTGALTLMCNTATAALGPIVAANNTFVYVLDQANGQSPARIFEFLIAHGNSGALAAVTGSPFTLSETITGNFSLVADPLGRFIFVTNQANNDVHVLTIGQSGALTEAANSPFVVANPDFIAINPAGNVAYVPDSTDGNIFIFTLNSTGQLGNNPNSQSPVIIGMGNNAPHFAVVHPNGNFLITANELTLSSFSIDPNAANGGALTQIGGSPFSPGGAGDAQVAPLDFALDMSGKFLYVTPEGTVGAIPGFVSDNIVAFAFDTTAGGMTPVPMSPFISSSTLDIVANPLLEQMFIVTSNTSSILFGVAPIDASGNLTLPTTSLAVTAEIHPVVVNIN
jgi:6-phosphogluconolactonase (cycloisomerase 2 family)